MGSKAKITTVSIVRENEVIPMNKAIPPCKNTAAKIAVDFHLSDAKVAAAMYSSTVADYTANYKNALNALPLVLSSFPVMGILSSFAGVV